MGRENEFICPSKDRFLALRLLLLIATTFVILTGASARAQTEQELKEVEKALVSIVQETLRDRGFDAGPVDGAMGPRTSAALRAYQESVGLPLTGLIDAATLERLYQPRTRAPVAKSSKVEHVNPGASNIDIGMTVAWILVALVFAPVVLYLLGYLLQVILFVFAAVEALLIKGRIVTNEKSVRSNPDTLNQSFDGVVKPILVLAFFLILGFLLLLFGGGEDSIEHLPTRGFP